MPDHQSFPVGNVRQYSPEEITDRTFPTVRRGSDPDAVKRFLAEVADQVRILRIERTDLERSAQRPVPQPGPPVLDEVALTKALGEETTRVLQTARDSAHAIAAKAERRAAELVADAEALAAAMREEADTTLRSAAARAESEAASLIDRTKTECLAMIEEAREARRRILADLAQRRKVLLVELEQVRAGRDSMAAMIESVASSVASSIESARGQLAGVGEEAVQLVVGEEVGDLDESQDDGEDVDSLVAPAIVELPSSGEEAESTGDRGQSGNAGGQVFDIERELPPADDVRSGTGLSPGEPAVVHEPERAPAPERHERLPDRSPTVSETAAARPEPAVRPTPSAAGTNRSHDAWEGEEPRAEDQGELSAVDRLFAKIRASRESSVADAQRVLGATEEPTVAGRGPRRARTDEVAPADSAAEPAESSEGAVDAEAPEDREPDPDPVRARRDALIGPAQHELARALKRVLREEQNLLLDTLRNRRKNDAAGSVELEAAARARLLEAVLPGISRARGAAGAFLGGQARGDAEAGSADLGDARPIAERLVGEIVDALNTRLGGRDGAGADRVDLAERVGIAFRDWKATRIDSLAGDFATDAFGDGAVSYGRARQLSLSWRFDDAGSDCPDCDDNAMAGAVVPGDAFPTGHSHPPVHPGCRCFLIA